MGYINVSTYINSGNVLFEAHSTDFSHIEESLFHTFGFEIKVLIRDKENIKDLVGKIPEYWTNDTEQKTDILFLWDEYNIPDILSEIQIHTEFDHLLYIDGAIVWNIKRTNYNKSKMSNFIKNPIYKYTTARNINTVRKLAQLLK